MRLARESFSNTVHAVTHWHPEHLLYGLSGAVVSADRERALAVARRIRAGTMSVDGGLYYAPDAPCGGYEQSGVGREMGLAGLAEFLELETLAEPVA